MDPGETVIAEAGAMNYFEEGISFEAKMEDGSTPDEGIMHSPSKTYHWLTLLRVCAKVS